jgi:hypothetical protein
MIRDEDILFVTTSMHTKWQSYSSACVKHFFPESKHLIIDGRKGWPRIWFKWTDEVQKYDTKYVIHIDEDCFLQSRQEVINIIDKLEQTNSCLAGVPDAHFALRGFNEVALNAFFMVGDLKKLKKIFSNKKWRNSRFNKKWISEVKYDYKVSTKARNTTYEPYYVIFWAILNANEKLLYLYPHDDFQFANQENRIPATTVKLLPNTSNICTHMWYLRQWKNRDHINRYNKIERFLNDQNILLCLSGQEME